MGELRSTAGTAPETDGETRPPVAGTRGKATEGRRAFAVEIAVVVIGVLPGRVSGCGALPVSLRSRTG